MSANNNALGTNFADLDAHVVQPEEYDDIPELDDAWFDTAVLMLNGVAVQPSEPLPERKMRVTLRLDHEVVAFFKAAGPGWRMRMNAALRAAMPEAS